MSDTRMLILGSVVIIGVVLLWAMVLLNIEPF
jgi:hypothetical protein